MTIADIREWNDLKSDNIMAGQVLVVDAKKAVKKKTTRLPLLQSTQ